MATKKPSLAERELLRREALTKAGTPYVPATGPSLAQRELLRRTLLKEAGTPYVPAYERAKPATTAAEKQAIRNAFTLGAPSDDRKAKARAMAAQAIFNDLERSKASPEELAAAKREADSWANWASLPKSTRENILSRGRRQAELGNATSKFGAVMNELGGTDEMGNPRNKGAEELLKYEADVMAGRNPEAFKSETSSTGRKVVYRNGIPVGFSGAAPSPISDSAERSMVNRTGLFSPSERKSIRDQIMAEAVNPTSPAPRPSPSYAQNILMDFQSRQPSAPQAFQYQPDAYSILNAPPSSITASSQPTQVAMTPRQPVSTAATMLKQPMVPAVQAAPARQYVPVGDIFTSFGFNPRRVIPTNQTDEGFQFPPL